MAKTKFDFAKIGIKAAGLGVGVIGAGFGNKLLPNLNPMLRGALKVAVGVGLPLIAPKQDFIEHIGDGIIAAGMGDVIKQVVPALAGIGMDDEAIGDQAYVDDYEMNMGAVTNDESLGQDDEQEQL